MPTDNYIPPPGQNLLTPSDMIPVVVEVAIRPNTRPVTPPITKRFGFHTYPLAQEFIASVTPDPKATGSIIQALAHRAMLLRVPLAHVEGADISVRILPRDEPAPDTNLMNPDDAEDAAEDETPDQEDYDDDNSDDPDAE